MIRWFRAQIKPRLKPVASYIARTRLGKHAVIRYQSYFPIPPIPPLRAHVSSLGKEVHVWKQPWNPAWNNPLAIASTPAIEEPSSCPNVRLNVPQPYDAHGHVWLPLDELPSQPDYSLRIQAAARALLAAGNNVSFSVRYDVSKDNNRTVVGIEPTRATDKAIVDSVKHEDLNIWRDNIMLAFRCAKSLTTHARRIKISHIVMLGERGIIGDNTPTHLPERCRVAFSFSTNRCNL
ncbi:MAG: hypothetical protein EB059_06945 [Alphaproteobacteria bacterium]|nr:hypothetical protein [Alphaproteobacteria bacterium]